MSAETVTYTPENQLSNGLMNCPFCNYEIPENLVVCWRCGERLDEAESKKTD